MAQVISLNFGLAHAPPNFDYDFSFEDLDDEIKEQLPDDTAEAIQLFSEEELQLLRWRICWRRMARIKQLPPPEFESMEKSIWMIRSGRGYGKTLTGSNWLGIEAAMYASFYAVVSPTHDDVRYVCFEGPTGLLACIPPKLIKDRNLALPSISLTNGSIIRGFAGDTPERLRGPQHSKIWCLTSRCGVLTYEGEKPIIDVQVGDLVATRLGYRRVVASGMTHPNAEIWRVSVQGHQNIEGTAEHPIYVEGKGFTPLCQLEPNDLVLNSMVENSIFNPEQGITLGQLVLGLGQKTSESAYVFIEQFTNTTVVQFLRVILFTIKMGTQRIIKLATWSVCLGGNTLAYTIPTMTGWDLRRGVKSQKNDGQEPRIGVALVRSAENLFGLVHQNLENSVHRSVWRNIDQGAMPRRDRAYGVMSLSRLSVYLEYSVAVSADVPTAGNMGNKKCYSRVIRVEKSQRRKPVYNLTIEGAHEFFANGILVHNCDEIASFKYPQECWDNLSFGLRLGDAPQILVTGTPKPTPFIRRLQKDPRTADVVGSTYENRANLTEYFFESIAKYEGTRVGRQEIWGEVLDPEEEGFVKRSQWRMWSNNKSLPKFKYIVLSIDPAFTEKNYDKRRQENDPTACSAWGVFDVPRQGKPPLPHVMLLDAWEDWLGFPALVKKVKKEQTYTYGDADEPLLRSEAIPKYRRAGHQGRKPDIILIEEKGSGISLRQQLAEENVLTHGYNPGNEDKLSRLHYVSPMYAAGRVWAVESDINPGNFKDWADPLVSQVCSYVGPGSTERDDLLDTATQALRFLMDRFFGPFTVVDTVESRERANEKRVAERRLKKKSRKNPYDS